MKLLSGTSYWLLADGLRTVWPALAREERCDVLVVGAGISGALVAQRLAREGADVVVLDRRHVATGSTVGSTGLLQYETDVELQELAARLGDDGATRAWRAGADAIDELEALVATLPDDCGFARRDAWYLAFSRRDARRVRKEHAARTRLGFACDLLDGDALHAAGFQLDAHAAIRTRHSAQVNAHRLTHELLADAARRGARIHDRTTVGEVQANGNGVTVATDRGHTVRAGLVVWATGYEARARLPRPVGRLRSTFAVAGEPVTCFEGWPDRALLWEAARPYLYLRTTADGRPIIGGLDTRSPAEHRLPGMVARRAEKLAARFATLFPAVPFEPAFAWGGTFAETEDGLPYIGAHPQVPRALFALGYGGNGIVFSVVAARVIADHLAGRARGDEGLYAFGRDGACSAARVASRNASR